MSFQKIMLHIRNDLEESGSSGKDLSRVESGRSPDVEACRAPSPGVVLLQPVCPNWYFPKAQVALPR